MSQDYDKLNAWFSSPAGHAVIAAIDEKLKPILNQLRGEHLLQIGIDSQFWHYNLFRFQHVNVVSPSIKAAFASMVAEVDELPVEDHSMDCIIAPFSLEMSEDTDKLISELDRVLSPMGYLVMIGLNPWGLWGHPARLCQDVQFPPSLGQLVSAFSLRRDLNKRGYNIQLVDNFYYLPAVQSVHRQAKLSFLNEVGKMLWPIPGSFYLLLAQKFQLDVLGPHALSLQRTGQETNNKSPLVHARQRDGQI